MPNQDYIARLQVAIQQLHNCGAVHVETVPVHEVFQGKPVWKGEVEVFAVIHPRANRCYAWSHKDSPDDKDERFVAVLEIPPVKDAQTAVQVSILADKPKQ